MNISNFPEDQSSLLHLKPPAGYTVRPVTLADIPAAVDLFNEVSLRDEGSTSFTADDLRLEWDNPIFDLRANTLSVWSAEGTLAGYVEVWVKPAERMQVWARVRPAHEGQGIGTYLMRWAEARARANLVYAAEGAQVVVHVAYKTGHTPTATLFQSLGYTGIRQSYRMRIDMTEEPEAVTLPAGFRLRDYHHPEDVRLLAHADIDAFRDHWGFIEPDEAAFDELVQELRHWFDTDPLMDPSLTKLVVDEETGEIAGVVLNRLEHTSDPASGFVDGLGVLRPYRKRGLGGALLRWSFGEFYRRGKRSVILGVDAGSLTGALRLYENAGMRVEKSATIYEKVLREGTSVMTTEIAETQPEEAGHVRK